MSCGRRALIRLDLHSSSRDADAKREEKVRSNPAGLPVSCPAMERQATNWQLWCGLGRAPGSARDGWREGHVARRGGTRGARPPRAPDDAARARPQAANGVSSVHSRHPRTLWVEGRTCGRSLSQIPRRQPPLVLLLPLVLLPQALVPAYQFEREQTMILEATVAVCSGQAGRRGRTRGRPQGTFSSPRTRTVFAAGVVSSKHRAAGTRIFEGCSRFSAHDAREITVEGSDLLKPVRDFPDAGFPGWI